MDIRPAVVDDAAAIAEVHVRSWQETYHGQVPHAYLDGLSIGDRTAAWQAHLSGVPPPQVLVAVDDGEVVAFIVVGQSRDEDADETSGEVPAIYARRQVWDRGVGRRLMEHGLQLLVDAGCRDATLWVLATNNRARRFYEAGAWSADGATKEADIGGQRVIEVRYRRPIASKLRRRLAGGRELDS